MLGIISGIVSGITSAITSVCSSIGGCFSTGITSIGRFASTVLEVGKKALGLEPLGIFRAISNVISGIAEVLGLKQKDEDSPEELGLKMEQADKKIEDFSSTEEYIRYLHKEIELDKEKMNALSMEEKAAYTSVGGYTYLKCASEKLGFDQPIGPELVMDYVRLDMQPKEFVTYMEKMKEANVENPSDFSDYLHNQSGSLETAQKVKSGMMVALQQLNPGMDAEAAMQSILDMKDILRD